MHNLYLEGKRKDPKLNIKHYDCKNINLLILDLKEIIDINDIIYIKGSRGMKMEKIIEGIV